MTATGEAPPASGAQPERRPITREQLEVVVAALPLVRPAPRWVAPFFAAGALALVPWIVYLGFELPEQNVSRHWDLTWVGFDLVLLLALARTAWFAWRGRRQVELSAVAAGTLLLVDAWFDVTTAAPGMDMAKAIVFAAVLEIPMALLAFWIARHVETVCAQAQRRIAGAARRHGM